MMSTTNNNEIKIFDNYHDFYHFVQWYEGELILKNHNDIYDKEDKLIAKLIKK